MENGVTGYFDLTHASTGTTVRIHYSQTYDIASNTSTVAITKVEVKSSTKSDALRYLDGSISVGDTEVISMSSYYGTHSVYIGNKDTFYEITGELGSIAGIVHNDDGSKNITISASITAYKGSGGSDWRVSGSETVILATIPRASILSVSNGTLGTAQDLGVSRHSTAFSHAITYECGTANGVICEKTQSESISFTLPIDLAKQNTKGTSVSVTFILQTYSGDTPIASPVSVTVTMAIPDSVKPTCRIAVSDAMKYASQFGGYVQGESKLSVVVNTVEAYSSEIATYRTNANGLVYTEQSFETEVLATAGTHVVSSKVTDNRGRESDASEATITVLAYKPPVITSLAVHRCNEDGTENQMGSFAKVTYSHEITSLSNKNAKNITLQYKKSSATEYTPVPLNSAYIATGAEYIFAADDGSSYDIVLVVGDSFHTSERSTSVSTADVIMHVRADGKGIGFGKVSEAKNALDLEWDIVMNEHSIRGLPTPTEPTQAVPKSYVDNLIGGGSGGGTTSSSYLVDRTTGKKYVLFVDNGKLKMEESEE